MGAIQQPTEVQVQDLPTVIPAPTSIAPASINFDTYQQLAKSTSIYPAEVKGLYPLMGLAGETAELIEKANACLRISTNMANTNDEQLQKLDRVSNIFDTIVALGKELEVLKKDFRKNGLDPSISIEMHVNDDERDEINKEMGDQMWYQSATCEDFGLTLNNAAVTNYNKLKSRQERGVLNGSGDNR